MKKLMVVLIIGMSLNLQAQEIMVSVKGMVCSFCAQGIEKNFKTQDSVKNIEVDLSKNFVKLTLKEKQSLEDSTIKKLIEDAGYNVEKIERK